MNTDGRHFPLVSERNEELLSEERGFRGDSAPHWREAEGGAVDATWSVGRCNVERRPMQRGAWADATWSVKQHPAGYLIGMPWERHFEAGRTDENHSFNCSLLLLSAK